MARRQSLEIVYPQGGLHRAFEFQQQPPYTMADGLNVRGRDSILRRRRGGSRPMLTKAFPTQLGSGNPIRLMATCRTLNTDAQSGFNEPFDGSSLNGLNWMATGTYVLPLVGGGVAYAIQGGNVQRGALLYSVTDISTSAAREVSMEIDNQTTLGGGKTYYLQLDTRDSATTNDEGVLALLSITFSGSPTVALYVNGGLVAGPTPKPIIPFSVRFRLTIDSHKTIKVYYGAESDGPVLTYLADSYTPAYSKAAFQLYTSTSTTSAASAKDFSLSYYSTTPANPPTMLMASSNGTLYKQTSSGTLSAVTATVTLASDRLLTAANRLQSLYIADYGVLKTGTDGKFTTSATPPAASTFDDNAGTAWNAISGLYVGDFLRVTAPSGNVADYRIQSIDALTMTVVGGLAPGVVSGLTYKILRGPKVYDSATNNLTEFLPLTTLVPGGCTLVETWMNRLAWAGDPDFQHRAFLSAEDDPTDYDYGSFAAGSAVAYSEAESTSEIGDRIRSMSAHRDDYMIFGGETNSALQRGDPTRGGRIDTIAKIGVLDRAAWCRTPDGYWIAMTPDGLYRIPPTPEALPEPLSRAKLPLELRGLNPATHAVQIAYDQETNGVHIFIVDITLRPVATTHWFFDLETEAFEPMSIAYTSEPTAMCEHALIGETPTVFFGGRDGYVRRMSDAATTDDGTVANSYVTIGPVRLGSTDAFGRLASVNVGTGAGSADVAVYIYVGDTAEEAYNADAELLGTVSAGVRETFLPYRTGDAAFIEIVCVSGRWALEHLSVGRVLLGGYRAR